MNRQAGRLLRTEVTDQHGTVAEIIDLDAARQRRELAALARGGAVCARIQ